MTEGLVTIVKGGGHGGRIIEYNGRRYCDLYEAASQLKVSRLTVKKWFDRGKFPEYVRDRYHRGKPYIPEDVIRAMIRDRLEPVRSG
ncbi:hypothetical protein J4234_06770 [Candidatus Woesearchaeota archaeon]|nr:hypothetical protein [Candidatus Woesearchaeota archaeon]